MRKSLIICIGILFLGIGGWWIWSQGKNGGGPGISSGSSIAADKPFANPLMKYVPSDAISVAVCDFRSPAFRRLRNSEISQSLHALFQPGKFRTMLQTWLGDRLPPAGLEALEKIQKLIDAVVGAHWPTESLGRYIVYQNTLSEQKLIPPVTTVAEYSQQPPLAELAEKLKQAGFELGVKTEEGTTLYSIELKTLIAFLLGEGEMPKELGQLDVGMHTAASSQLLVSSTERERAIAIARGQAAAQPIQLEAASYYPIALNKLPYDQKLHHCYQVADVPRMLEPHFAKIRSLFGSDTGQEDTETKRRILWFLDHFPVLAQVRADGYDEGLITDSIFILQKIDDIPVLKRWISSLQVSGEFKSTHLLPSSPIVAFSLSATVLRALRDNLQTDGIPIPPTLIEQLKVIDEISDLSLAIKYVAGEELFPSATLAVTTSKPEELALAIERLVPMDTTPGTPSLGAWMDKTVEEVAVRYAASPMGVGVFVAKLPGGIVASSSEVGIRRAIISAQSKSETYSQSLHGRHHLSGSDSALLVYFDISELLSGIRSALSTFAGMAPPQLLNWPEEVIRLVDAVGSISATVGLEDEVIRIRSAQRAKSR